MRSAFSIVLLMMSALAAQAQSTSGAFVARQFEKELRVTAKGKYLLYLPREYAADSATKWPLVLFLHGAGERGEDLELVKRNGLPHLIAGGKEFDFILAAPQCPEHETWSVETLRGLLDDVAATYRVDPARVYLTGLSLGGWGTWNLAIAYPERFAAVVPVCGIADKYMAERVCRLKEIPTRVYHGAKDDIVPISDSERMVNALKACGGNVELTVFPEANHNAWDLTYDNPELYRWLLEQHK